MKIFSATLKGTTTVSQGTTNLSGSFTGSFSGSLAGIAGDVSDYSSSVALRATTLEAASGSFSTRTTNIERVYATTGSNTFTGAQVIQGTLTAQTLVVQTVTSSVLFTTGSNRLGSSLSNVQELTGSVGITGSLSVNTNGTEFQVSAGGVNIGNALTDNHVVSGSFTINPNGLFVSSSGNVGIGNVSPTVALDVTGVANFSSSVTAAKIITSTTLDGDPQLGFFTNASTGTSAEAVIYIKNGATTNDATFVEATGTNFTTTGGFVQDGGIVGTGTSLAGGLSLMVRANADMRFYTNGHTNERMRITSAGNVGIGTSSPTNPLQVETTGADLGIQIYRNVASDGGSVPLFLSHKSTAGTIRTVNIEGIGSGDMLFRTGATGLATFGTVRMTITSGGNVCIGMNTSPYGRVSIKSNSATIYAGFGVYAASNENFTLLNHDGNVGYIGCDSTATGFATPLAFWINSAIRMTMSTNGSIGAPSGTNIYNASDVRLKKNISTTTYGLNAISALNPVKFNWVDGFEPSEDGKDMLGFVAQEVQTVIPEAIESFGGNSIKIGDTTIDNPLRVNEKFIIPVLVKAIQEQQAQIDELKAKLQ